MLKRLKINPLEWLGYLFAPIQKNGAFFVFMFALGWICTQLEITLHVKGAKPYELSAPELFLDIYAVCVILTLIPRKVRYWVRALLYVILYSVALVDMFCYVKFESTLTPTMLMLFGVFGMGYHHIVCWLDSVADSGSYSMDHSAQGSVQYAQTNDSAKDQRDGSNGVQGYCWCGCGLVFSRFFQPMLGQ